MMKKYEIVTHVKVKKFIENLDNTRQARIDRFYELFEEYGVFLPARYLKKVAKNVWELRPGDVRLFLTIKGNKGFVIHGIRKKGQKLPKKELSLAIKRIKEEVG